MGLVVCDSTICGSGTMVVAVILILLRDFYYLLCMSLGFADLIWGHLCSVLALVIAN